MASLLTEEARGKAVNSLAPKQPHFTPKAKSIIFLYMDGGPSSVDTFDPKPRLTKEHGQPFGLKMEATQFNSRGKTLASPWQFQHYGQAGIPISDLFPHVARHADKLCVIRSMHTDVPNHHPSFLMMNCGDTRFSRPSLGSWVTYGLGSENRNLPGYVVLCPDGQPTQGAQNWRSAFLPGAYQGTHIDTKHRDPRRLVENVRHLHGTARDQRRQLDLLAELNRLHREERPADPRLEARIESFELAYRMQLDATDALDVSLEPDSVQDLYGRDVQGRQMLMARRLLERGVRFVQVYHGAGQPWDTHVDNSKMQRDLARECDRAIGALLVDLKRRGLLEETLVVWSSEFGRTPVAELPPEEVRDESAAALGENAGRDHDNYGFTAWLAGGGVRGGTAFGATDEFGFRAAVDPVHVHDLHATILHLLGFDHERLTYRHAGRDFRLTDVHGRVLTGILA